MNVSELPKIVQIKLNKLTPLHKTAFIEEYERKKKSEGIAYLLYLLTGWHYAYTKKWGLQILWTFTWGGFFVWAIIDLFRIPSIIRNYNKDLAIKIMNEFHFEIANELITHAPYESTIKQDKEISKLYEATDKNQISRKTITDIKKTEPPIAELDEKDIQSTTLNEKYKFENSAPKTNEKYKLLIFTLCFSIILLILGIIYKEQITQTLFNNHSKNISSDTYKGLINNKYPITMKIIFIDDKVDGFYFYDKIGKTILIKGNVKKDSIEIRGVYNNALVDIFKGKLKENKIDGKWRKPGKKASYGFHLKKIKE